MIIRGKKTTKNLCTLKLAGIVGLKWSVSAASKMIVLLFLNEISCVYMYMYLCGWWMCTVPQQGLAGLAGLSQSESRSCSCHLSSHITFFLTGVNKRPREMSPHNS